MFGSQLYSLCNSIAMIILFKMSLIFKHSQVSVRLFCDKQIEFLAKQKACAERASFLTLLFNAAVLIEK